jgi:hypothetical protein
MARGDSSNTLLFLALGGAVAYWWYQQQQQEAAALGVDNTISGDVAQVESTVDNYVMASVAGQTRGERNNNPGNLRHTSPEIAWQGLSAVQSDPDFLQFNDVLHGIRAMHINLLTYFNSYGLKTITGIINRWAPPKDHNATAAYIIKVSNRMGIAPAAQIDLTDLTKATSLVDAIIQQENGRDIYAATGQLAQAMAMT